MKNREGDRVARKKNDQTKDDDVTPRSDEPADTAAVENGVEPDDARANPDATDADTLQDNTVDTDPEKQPEDASAAPEAEPAIVSETDPLTENAAEPEVKPEEGAPDPGNSMPLRPEPQRHSAVPVVIGGAVAAVLGFLAARADLLDNILPPSLRAGAETRVANEKIDALQDALDAAQARISGLQNEIANMAEPDTSDLDNSVAALSDRLNALEARPVASGTGGPVSFDADFAQLQATAKAQQAELERLLAEARSEKESNEAAAQAALARAAVTRIAAAIDSGEPFAQAVNDLSDAGVDVPAVLREVAADGVAPLAALQAEIPDAARSALAAARSANTDGGIGSFLQRQLGARSVTPKEGSDPDAVLSRVEAAVREGRLDEALSEADALPPEGISALAPWLDRARTRNDATTATEALMQRLTAN